ncbi:hypothetical protein Dthio_PD2681 [Desulfonatronospira thiodismutans ASO3-1]|uniref:Uncharacterized protein n=1 Tax=Desulfonatronospira thiodismutans ASO3-1 TaxID=555779 RepID=D6SKQ9_9BACT|nr:MULTISPECIES: TIGR03790 family protein [Desulfonatronospira]EFI35270.1 hypothetical protein Dthio_PD2681 [Desulfonatronospira thiodismutans ASO3-1]
MFINRYGFVFLMIVVVMAVSFLQQKEAGASLKPEEILVVANKIQTEEAGLQGRAYFDARWPMPDERPQGGYGLYDYSLHQAALHLQSNDIMPVTVEETSALFQPGDCPEAALYAGWYSLARYVPAFEWQPGSVGYHIASQECQSLRRGEYWCKRMLEEGVAATLGPVGEPYVQAFPPPEIFLPCLRTGVLVWQKSILIPYHPGPGRWSWWEIRCTGRSRISC